MESAEDPAPQACSSSIDIATVTADFECMEDIRLSTSTVKVLPYNRSDTAAAGHWMQEYSTETTMSWIVQNASKKNK